MDRPAITLLYKLTIDQSSHDGSFLHSTDQNRKGHRQCPTDQDRECDQSSHNRSLQFYMYEDRESDQHYHLGQDLEGAEQYSMDERISDEKDEEDSINETEDKQELQQDPPNDDGANNYVDDVAKMEEMVCTVEEASARRGDVSQP